jgi:hypothetical protein
MFSYSGVDYIFFYGRNGKRLSVTLLFPLDAAFIHWLERIPNLDAEGIAQSLREVELDATIGVSPKERVDKLVMARKVSVALQIISGLVAVWALFYPRPYLLSWGVLALMPWVAIGLCIGFRGLFTLEDAGIKTARPDLTAMLILPGFLLALRALADVHLVSWRSLSDITVAGTALFAVIVLAAEPKLRRRVDKLLLCVVLLSAYPASVAALINVTFEHEPPSRHRVLVLDKVETTGKDTRGYFTLPAWGPYSDRNNLDVNRALYRRVQKGEAVCVFLYAGALHMPHYVVRDEESCDINSPVQ